MQAYKRVKANAGATGIDQQSLECFGKGLKNNLYKLWNRMSSGSYFPPPVKAVAIPKKTGGERILGVPTVADRIAQKVVKLTLEPEMDKHFHPDSYGYRLNKSALDAVGVTRQRCWQYDWVVEFDIKGLFDNIPHDLLMKAVRKHTDCKWSLLYIERWLKAPMQMPEGQATARTQGTPQGGVISPLLSHLFLHYVFDVWMSKQMAQQRTDNAALRRALGSFCRLTLRHLHGRFQPPLYVQQTPFAVCMFPDRFHQEVMGNVVKQALDVKLHNPIILPAALAGNADRIQGGFVRAVPI